MFLFVCLFFLHRSTHCFFLRLLRNDKSAQFNYNCYRSFVYQFPVDILSSLLFSLSATGQQNRKRKEKEQTGLIGGVGGGGGVMEGGVGE